MLPNPEVGAPFTTAWWAALFVLVAVAVIVGVISKLMVASVNRALAKRDNTESARDNRLAVLEEAIREMELKSLQRDAAHDEKLHDLELAMIRCKQEQCSVQAKMVTTDMHHGDFLRVEHLIQEKVDKLVEAVTDLHRRIDSLMASVGRRKVEWSREDD